MFATRVTASISEQAVPDPTTVGTSLVQDTLSKADKLNVGCYPAESAPVENIPAVPTEPIAAEIQPATPPATAKAGSSQAPDPGARRTAIVLPKPRPRIRPAKHARGVGLARATVDPNTCHQQDGLGGMLISLSGAPRCELWCRFDGWSEGRNFPLIFPREGLIHVEISSRPRRFCDRPFRADIVPACPAALVQMATPLICRSSAHSRDPLLCRSFARFLFRNVSDLTFATRRNMLAGVGKVSLRSPALSPWMRRNQ
jgi:hypothetical protein